MAITQQELGRRIRAGREAGGLTQEKLAERIGVSRSAMAQMEAGNRAVSSLELDRLARALGRDIREFVADSFEEVDVLAALFRAEPAVAGRPDVIAELRRCVEVAREQMNLERLLGADHLPMGVVRYELAPFATRWDAIRQGQELADEERRRLGLSSTPLPDLVELLEMQGVRTEVLDLPDEVSGITVNDRSAGLLVVVNRAHHYLRRRFSFAHEYAHVLVDRERVGLVSRTTERDNLLEVRANAFAAAFLSPEDGVRQFMASLGKGQPSRVRASVFDEAGDLDVEARSAPGSQDIQIYDVALLAHHFGVSRLAALYRLRNLRLITEAEFEHLKTLDAEGAGRQVAQHLGLPEPDHDELRNRFHSRFIGLALEAHRREEISRGKLKELAKLVGIDGAGVDALLDDSRLDGGSAD
jgi:Zn-dependent peptidase ImmA (M78 family)/DNA-binding XRE family transcriptional regulator